MRVVLMLMVANVFGGVFAAKKVAPKERKVVCYYTNWSVYRQGLAKFSPQNINPYLCTHLIYSFGGITDEFEIQAFDKYQDFDKGGYSKFVGLKSYNKDLKVSLALGGWNEGSRRWSALVEDQENRRTFIRSVIKTLRTYNFDGLDLDWEYPAFRDGGNPEDKENYVKLVKELRLAFEKEADHNKNKERLFLSMAVPAGIEYIEKGFDVESHAQHLDFFNILSYDYHGAYESYVDHHAPLFTRNDLSEFDFKSQLTIDYTVNYYLQHGVPAEKLVLGIPTYGRTFKLLNSRARSLGSPADGPGDSGKATKEDGFLAYYEICENILVHGWKVERPDPDAIGPYAYKGNQWVGYDDEDMVRKKARYTVEKGLGGIMFWSIDNDDFRGRCSGKPFPLIEAAKEALLSDDVYENKARKIQDKTSKNSVGNDSKVTSTTPEPPTTPDPGADFTCAKEGYFVHPHDCKKYFWCLNSNIGLVAHQFTCPAGLYFSKGSGTCDFARNVICKPKPVTPIPTFGPPTSSTEPTTFKPKTAIHDQQEIRDELSYLDDIFQEEKRKPEVIIEKIEEPDENSSEDGHQVSRLTKLLEKLGGIKAVEALLTDGSPDKASATERPLSGGGGRRGPQFIPSTIVTDENTQLPLEYVTLRRNRPSEASANPSFEDVSLSQHGVEATSRKTDLISTRFVPQYVTIRRNRPSTEKDEDLEEYFEEDDENQNSDEISKWIKNHKSSSEEETDFSTTPISSLKHPSQRLSANRQTTTERALVTAPAHPTPQRYNNIRLNLRNKTPATEDGGVTKQLNPVAITRNPLKHRKTTSLRTSTDVVISTTHHTTTTTTTITPITQDNTPLNIVEGPSTLNPLTFKEDYEDDYEYYDDYYDENPSNVSSSLPQIGEVEVIPNTSSPKPLIPGSQQLKQRITSSEGPDPASPPPFAIPSSSLRPSTIKSVQTSTEVVSTTTSRLSLLKNRRIPGSFTTKKPTLDTRTTRKPFVTRRPTTVAKVVTDPPRIRQPLIQREKIDIRTEPTVDSTPKRIVDPRPILIGSNPASSKPSSGSDDDYDYDYELFDYIYDFSQLDQKIAFYDDGTFECLEHGTFPHPISCRKFISCVKVETGGIRGWIYKCPSGLVFDPVGNMCNWEERSFCARG